MYVEDFVFFLAKSWNFSIISYPIGPFVVASYKLARMLCK